MGGSDKAKMKAWLIHPTGNRNVRAAAHALESSGLLETFHSCLSIGHDCPNPLASRLFAQRRFDIPDDRIKRHMLREGLRLFAQKLGFLSSLLKHETGPLSIDQVYHSLDSAVAGLLEKTTNCPEAIYAYEDGAFEVFSVAKRRGIHRIYDLPIGYWRAARRIQAEEAERQPAWAMTMPALRDSESKLSRKDEELGLAERIYVASSFTASTLSEVPFEIPQATVIPYGCPAPILDRTVFARPTERLRVLYVV
ncbi:MAG: glycosyl transferase family 1, partial [Verrucomicrobiota bacterium]